MLGDLYEFERYPALVVCEDPLTVLPYHRSTELVMVRPEELQAFTSGTQYFDYRYLAEDFNSFLSRLATRRSHERATTDMRQQVEKATADFAVKREMVLTHLAGHVQSYGVNASDFWRRIGEPEFGGVVYQLEASALIAYLRPDAPNLMTPAVDDYRLAKYHLWMHFKDNSDNCYCTTPLATAYVRQKVGVARGVDPETIFPVAVQVNRCVLHPLPLGLESRNIGRWINEG